MVFLFSCLVVTSHMSCQSNPENPDVVIVGATPSGIMAAISAARMGSDVLLLEATDHIGGIVTNGLTMADIIKRNAVGGLFKEYTNNILRYYEDKYGMDSEQVKLCTGGYNSEPHVAEQVFHQMIDAEARVKVLYNHRLKKTLVEGNKLVGVTTEDLSENKNQENFSAKVFIDATYEGDLAAMAGAKYREGRESRNEFNEKQAGLIYSRFGFDEYLSGSTGNGDKAIQAFCFRLSMTREPNNRVDILKPDSYNRQDYLLLIDDIKTGKLAPLFESNLINREDKFQPVQMWIKPNGKVEINNEHVHPIVGAPRESVDLAEENWGYPEASYEEREHIVKRYLNYQLGLIWFLQNDPELPVAYREEASKWGLCKDEFVTNNHVPRQTYVRETRRIEGEYFLTQHDADLIQEIGRTRIQPTSIGIAEYPFDSHGCHKYNLQFPGTREGYFYIKHDPFQIPYGVLVPKEIDGLLVTICISASHVAYQSIRMEPVFMSLGQVAGIAASLSVESGKTVRNINVHQLQRLFITKKGVVTYFEDITVDDPDFEAFQFVGLIGGTKGYLVSAESIISVADAAEVLKRWTGKEVTDNTQGTDKLTGSELSAWFKNQNWNYSGPTSGEVTVRQLINAVHVNLDQISFRN
ncbi:MAG: FAD-dependent oxidoreductase [Prolixibacteraceae bacterium]|nr:FAD-dependent oxidoreductase [Prolixibacteraceae bacterium]